jgi:FMN phosphatase YigB (HAD superfamily)
MKPMPVRAITFDFWRTLFRHTFSPERRRNRIDAFVEATAADRDRVDKAMAVAEATFTDMHMNQHRTLGPRDAVRIMAAELKIEMSTQTEIVLADLFARGILTPPPPVIDGAIEAVHGAAERFPIGIISDTGFSPGAYLRTVLQDHEILDRFQVLVFSDEVGVSKPQAAMFERAAEGLGVLPSELLHIGDLEWTDIVGAKALGAKAALYAGDNDRHLTDNTADFVFHSWQEFLDPFLKTFQAPPVNGPPVHSPRRNREGS